jgi:hypothetical protein
MHSRLLSQLVWVSYTVIGPTQANEDGTDTWCESGTVIPTEMHFLKKYQEPVCYVPSCMYADFDELYEPFLYNVFDCNMYAGLFLCGEK